MKKVFISLLFAFVSVAVGSTVSEASEGPKDFDVDFKVQDVNTGEFLPDSQYDFEIIESKTTKDIPLAGKTLQGDSYTTDMAFKYTPKVTPLTIIEGSTNSTGVCVAFVRINYDISGQNIRLNGAGCSWTPTNTWATVSNRMLRAQQGFSTHNMERYPASNSYVYYSTGWGYVTNYGGNLIAGAESSATVTMSGMGSQRISCTVNRI